MPRGMACSPLWALPVGGSSLDLGQEDVEGGAAAEFAVHLDMAAGELDDAADGGQAEAGPFARSLGGEQGLEDACPDIGGHADAGVADGQQDIGAGAGVIGLGIGFVERDIVGHDGEPAAFGHGVAGVDGQVQDHLLHLPRIDLDRFQCRGEDGGQQDVVADQAAQHLLRVAHSDVEVEDLRLHRLLAAERQQLAGQRLGALARLANLADQFLGRFVKRLTAQQDFAVAEDDGEEIVEIVSDAAGELAEQLHFLGDEELLLQAAHGADVMSDEDGADGLAGVAVKGGCREA